MSDVNGQLRGAQEPAHVTHIAAADGVRLATDVYLPAPGTRRRGCGTVMVRLPYGRRGPVAFLPGLATLVTDHGWALVTQDVRGKFDSTGEREPFAHEIADGLVTLEWIGAQSWSDGRVVAAGDSYFGYTAWAAAATGHPSMRGIMVRVTSPSISRDWMHRQGVFMLGNMSEWAASTWTAPEWVEQSLDWTVRPSSQILASASLESASGTLDSWARSGGQELAAVDIPLAAALSRPLVVAHVGGWWDIFHRGQLDTWQRARRADPRGVHLLTMDAVDHVLDPLRRPGEPAVDVVADVNLRWAGLSEEWRPLLEVLDAVDADGASPPARSPVRWRPGLGEWRSDDHWPPAASTVLTMFPGEGSQATSTPEGGILAFGPLPAGTATWKHDPLNPVPTVERDLWRPLLSGVDQSRIHERDDVATFTSLPFDHEVTFAGPVRLHSRVGSGGPSLHVVATVCHVWPDGTAYPIADGAAHLSADSGDADVDLGHAAYVLPAGDRIRLAVAGSCYPRYALHPGTGEDPYLADTRVPMDQWIELGSSTWLDMTIAPE
jgi:putative CocE/NonD family hydrolase